MRVATDVVGMPSRIREAREASGLTQARAAQMLSLHRPSISEIEAGRRKVSSDELTRFADLYKVSTEWLLSGVIGGEDYSADVLAMARSIKSMTEAERDRLMRLIAMSKGMPLDG
jgi:transcriptional regulator with XRE-family HTH domain